MRISDWSSDVCSSDLIEEAAQQRAGTGAPEHGVIGADVDRQPLHQHVHRRIGRDARAGDQEGEDGRGRIGAHGWGCTFPSPLRSEEHTSELQSLMRISYAVFCLKKKNNKRILENILKTITETS